ncbi:GNAT family N-acetyltransferase [Cytobacillus sp. FJAT-54145]|uniref:GNAT family N-acetyltransferase n=1 Tax=Cytobacillus spartinae TaxID=3299023 RepID=A0ABW6K8D1_9BACI
MNSQKQIRLKRYTAEFNEKLGEFELPAEQEQFTAMPIEMLEVTEERHPIVILSDWEPVGFFVLHSSERVKEYSDNPKAMLLTALSINYAQQGKGYANKGMSLLRDFITQEFPNCNEVVLAVNHKNIPAQKLYEKVGFTDTYRRKIGRIGEQYIYSLTLG